MKSGLWLFIGIVALLSSTTHAIDFSKYKTCKDCTKAGFGWCSIRRICGGFANQECGEGERYHREDYKPEGSSDDKAKKDDEGSVPPKAESKSKIKPLRKFPGVITLTSDNFTKAVIESDQVWLVEFYAPWCGHCKALAPEWDKAARALKGLVRLGAVDADAHGSLGSQYGVSGFPTIKAFLNDKKAPKDYDGGRKATDIIEYALKQTTLLVEERMATSGSKRDTPPKKEQEPPKEEKKEEGPADDSDVIKTLTEENFEETVLKSKDMWLVEFFAPWCGHCKSLAPEWAKAASILKGTAKLAAVDATVQTALGTKYEVKGYPTIVVFEAGDNKKPIPGEFGRNTEAIVNYVHDKLEASGVPARIPELLNDATFQSCLGKKYCVIAILPHVIDTMASGRNELIEMLGKVSSKFRTFPASFYWICGATQTKFEETLNIKSGYPTMVIIDKARNRYVNHVGKFEEASLVKTIRSLQSGQISTTPLRSVPSMSTVEAWDGQDYKSE
jgi:protein disulfide-isomerase A6